MWCCLSQYLFRQYAVTGADVDLGHKRRCVCTCLLPSPLAVKGDVQGCLELMTLNTKQSPLSTWWIFLVKCMIFTYMCIPRWWHCTSLYDSFPPKHNMHIALLIAWHLGAVSIKWCRLTSVGIPMSKIRRYHDRLIFNMGISIPLYWDGAQESWVSSGTHDLTGMHDTDHHNSIQCLQVLWHAIGYTDLTISRCHKYFSQWQHSFQMKVALS